MEGIQIQAIAKKHLELITVSPFTTLGEALQILNANNIQSVPVFDPLRNMYLGFLDVMDITVFVVEAFAEKQTNEILFKDSKEEINQKIKARFNIPVSSVVNWSQLNPFMPVLGTFSVMSLVQGYFRQGLHRVPVANQQGQIIGTISQRDVIDLIAKHYEKFQYLGNFTIRDLLHAEDKVPVITVLHTKTMIQAFTEMIRTGVSGLAVVNEKNQIVANLSASDLRGIDIDIFYKLDKPIMEVLKDSFKNVPRPIVNCKETDTLIQVIQLISNTKVHRVYVLNESGTVIYVLTLTNLINIIARSFPAP